MYKATAIASLALIAVLSLATPPAFAADKAKVVNINEADAGKLALLPRVGPALSARILEFREENGKFKVPGDLLLVRGIGEKTFALMEPFVTVSGDTTLSAKIRVSDLQRQAEEKAEEKEDSDE